MKCNLLLSLVTCVLGAVGSGCANPINARTAQNYYDRGVQAEEAGDWALAAQNYSRAYGNAQLGNLGAKAEADHLYEFARVTGYAGRHEESERAFLDVLELIGRANGEADQLRAPALAEYSRLLHDTGQHSKAVPVYEDAVTELQNLGIESLDPMGYAALLDDYAVSLMEAGLPERASAMSDRASSLKAAHPNARPQFQPKRYKL